MRKLKRWMAVGLSSVMLLSMVACGSTEKNNSGEQSDYGEIWSVPATVKVKQTGTGYANKTGMKISLDAVRNEYESSQLVITADKDVDSFVLSAEDLSNGDAVLLKDNVTVYVQKFIPYADYTGSGYMADALIPMDAAAEKGENQITKGNNGALWVTVYIPKETAPGTYEGNFKLTMTSGDKTEEKEVPVSVKVWDYTLDDTITAKTLFSWRYDRVSVGEMDGSIEMMETYYEFFKDYRISLQSMPLETLSGEEFVANIIKYYDEITTYSLLKKIGDISGNILDMGSKVREQVLAVAKESTTERNLFDKAMIYSVDEPDLEDPAKREYVRNHNEKLNAFLKGCVDEISADTSGVYDEFKQIENWEDSILEIPNIIPMGTSSVEWLIQNENTAEGQELLELLNCICPNFGVFEDRLTETIQKLCKKWEIDLWWYGCVGPVLPAATYHLGDENLLSARTISWLQQKYDIEGNLYWDAAAYTDEANETYNEYINVYEAPYRITKTDIPAGDGFLAYPGAPYGVYGPLPSTRLMSIRDGMEEFEILKTLEKELEGMFQNYGENFSAKTAMESYYRALSYNGCYMNKDGENGLAFTALRADLLQMASGLKEGLGFVMGEVNIENENATFTYYVAEGSEVTINGEKQQTNKYSINLEEATSINVTVTNSKQETANYERFIGMPVYQLNTLSDNSVLDEIEVTDQSKATLVEEDLYSTDGTSVKFEVNGVLTGNNLVDVTFVPSASIRTSLFGDVQLAEMATIHMDAYNPGIEAIHTNIRLYSGTTYSDFGEFIIEPGANKITLNIAQKEFKQMDSVDRIAFEFVNAKDSQTLSYEFYLDNIIGEK